MSEQMHRIREEVTQQTLSWRARAEQAEAERDELKVEVDQLRAIAEGLVRKPSRFSHEMDNLVRMAIEWKQQQEAGE